MNPYLGGVGYGGGNLPYRSGYGGYADIGNQDLTRRQFKLQQQHLGLLKNKLPMQLPQQRQLWLLQIQQSGPQQTRQRLSSSQGCLEMDGAKMHIEEKKRHGKW